VRALHPRSGGAAGAERITDLLGRWNHGQGEAAERAVALLYGELEALARRYRRRERSGHTLDPAAIVHEAYLRLVGADTPAWKDRAHFIGIFARVMRRVLVDYARERNAAKRAGHKERVTLQEGQLLGAGRRPDVLALDDALEWLSSRDPQKATVVELRFFGGLSVEETAVHLGVSPATVNRQWRSARAWLYRALVPPGSGAGEPG
jgi:RNA polymerase sigma factor (TIGR02999 family)